MAGSTGKDFGASSGWRSGGCEKPPMAWSAWREVPRRNGRLCLAGEMIQRRECLSPSCWLAHGFSAAIRLRSSSKKFINLNPAVEPAAMACHARVY